MQIGLMTDSVAALSATETLDLAAELALDTIEFATGNWSTAPHLDLDRLLADEVARTEFVAAVTARGLRISALNANGNPLHPTTGAEQDRVVRGTIRLASLLDVSTVVCMSGLPAAPGDHTPNWITTCWPPETTEILRRQWDIAVPYWRELARFAGRHDVRLALEMHANQLVYNAPTLLRLREAAGAVVGANMDPSHLMWMGSDPIQSVGALDGAIYHVHAKDTRLQSHRQALTSRLETLPWERVDDRAWNYVTLGDGHPGGTEFWSQFIAALGASGYTGTLSIEHEDLAFPPVEGVRRSVDLLRAALKAQPAAWSAGRLSRSAGAGQRLLAVVARRWEIARDIALSAAGTAAVSGILVAVLGSRGGRPSGIVIQGYYLSFPVLQVALFVAGRFVWYRDSGPSLIVTRIRQIEHEAYLTMRAGRAGAAVPEIIEAGTTGPSKDALVVYRLPAGTALSEADATAAVFIQRLFSSYLPPIWGWATLIWMRKREYL